MIYWRRGGSALSIYYDLWGYRTILTLLFIGEEMVLHSQYIMRLQKYINIIIYWRRDGSELLIYHEDTKLLYYLIIYWRRDGSVLPILIIRLQKGQFIFSHPHCKVDSFGAFIELTVSSPVCIIKILYTELISLHEGTDWFPKELNFCHKFWPHYR